VVADPTEHPELSVVIPCLNEVDHINGCIDDIIMFERPPGGIEIIVVDGESDDGTSEVLESLAEEHPELRLISNPLRSTPAALNLGVPAARGKFIARIDVHTRYASDYLVACIDTMRGTLADNVGGPARTEGQGSCQRAIAAAYHHWFSVGGARFHDVEFEGPVDTVTYGCWRREVFERFGLFDEEFVRNQDDEHNLRITRGGGVVWQSPKIRSWYRPRSRLSELFRQYFQYGYWKVRVIQKHRIPASWRHLVPGSFVSVLVSLAAVGLIFRPAWWLLVGIVVFYWLVDAVAAMQAASRTDWGLFPLLLPVFATYHAGYGTGSVFGFVDFILLRRGPRRMAATLTRRGTSDNSHDKS